MRTTWGFDPVRYKKCGKCAFCGHTDPAKPAPAAPATNFCTWACEEAYHMALAATWRRAA